MKRSITCFPSLLKVHERILKESDEILIQQMAERVMEGKRLLGVSRLALKRIFYLSYAYRMTKEEKYAYRATQEMLSVSRFPDWNPSHFLDVGEMVLALSIGYDWLYEYLEPEIRSIVRHIACDELFHFIAKLIARSFCCSSLPNRNRSAGLRFGFGRRPGDCCIFFGNKRHVGAKSALLRRLFMPEAKNVIRPLPRSEQSAM